MTVPSRPRPPAAATRASLERLLEALDYDALGAIYCDSGGAAFWREHRPAVAELGLRWAAEAGCRLSPGGRSLYVGAGVAELPVLLFELLELGRSCTAVNLRAAECAVLNRALAEVGLADRLQLQPVDAAAVLQPGGFDHVAVVNVLDDPETFPQVSAVTYGRAEPWRLDCDAFSAERDRIRRLAAGILEALSRPGWVCTTGEEVPWFLERASQLGVAVRVDDVAVETALVGDLLGFVRVGAS